MVDFVGQKRVLCWSSITFLVFIPISLIVALILNNYIYSLYILIAVGAILMILFVPSWPWLSINPENWCDDKDFLEQERNLKITESPNQRIVSSEPQVVHRGKGIPRSKGRK